MARRSHWVVCKICGRQFDFKKAGGVYDGNRHICKSCSKKVVPSQTVTGDMGYYTQNKSWFKTNWKIIFGIFFLIGGFGNIGQDGQAAISGIIIGAVLVVAHFYPAIKTARLKKAETKADLEAKQREADLRTRVMELQAKAEEPKRCKTCGATTKGKICEYCGSLLD